MAVGRALMWQSEMALTVQRDVDATLIPSGDKVSLRAGTLVNVTQALGNAYTVHVDGNLVRVAGADGDALGLVVLAQEDINAEPISVEEKVWMQLRTCYDPEIPVNMVDLGLIYACILTPLGHDDVHVAITMTLTAPGCGMGPVLVKEIEEKLRQIREVKSVKIDLVFDPPWSKDHMTDEAKLQLGLL